MMTQQGNEESPKTGLYSKLSQIMGEMGSIQKGGTNTYFNYKFVTADAVASRVRDLLSQHRIAFFAEIADKALVEIRSEKERKNKNSGEITLETTLSQRWVVDFQFTFADGDSGETRTCLWSAEADSGDDKGINKCATAAEKYFLLKTFVVTSSDEPDADAENGKRPAQLPKRILATPNGLWTATSALFAERAAFDTLCRAKREELSGKTQEEAVALIQGWVAEKSPLPAAPAGAALNEPPSGDEPEPPFEEQFPPIGSHKAGGATEDDPRVYPCDRLIVGRSRTGITFGFGAGKTTIPVLDAGKLEGLKLNGDDVPALKAGTYPLSPYWSVTAEFDGKVWRIEKIVTEIPS